MTPCRFQGSEVEVEPLVRRKVVLAPADRWFVHVESNVAAAGSQQPLKLERHGSASAADVEHGIVLSKQAERRDRRRHSRGGALESPNTARVASDPQRRHRTAVGGDREAAVQPVEWLEQP